MIEWVRQNFWCIPFLEMLCFLPFVIAWIISDYKFFKKRH